MSFLECRGLCQYIWVLWPYSRKLSLPPANNIFCWLFQGAKSIKSMNEYIGIQYTDTCHGTWLTTSIPSLRVWSSVCGWSSGCMHTWVESILCNVLYCSVMQCNVCRRDNTYTTIRTWQYIYDNTYMTIHTWQYIHDNISLSLYFTI